MAGLIGLALAGCSTVGAPQAGDLLGENEIVDLMRNPRRWDDRVVTVRIFPFDNGFRGSYVVCFEACDAAYAARSPFLIYARQDRFSGYRGDRAEIVTARYSSGCFYRSGLCPDQRFGLFTEID